MSNVVALLLVGAHADMEVVLAVVATPNRSLRDLPEQASVHRQDQADSAEASEAEVSGAEEGSVVVSEIVVVLEIVVAAEASEVGTAVVASGTTTSTASLQKAHHPVRAVEGAADLEVAAVVAMIVVDMVVLQMVQELPMAQASITVVADLMMIDLMEDSAAATESQSVRGTAAAIGIAIEKVGMKAATTINANALTTAMDMTILEQGAGTKGTWTSANG